MATAVVNGVELYYDDIGSGECVVLTHGSWTDATGWTGAATLLAERYRVVAWDRRGHSRSRSGDGPGSRAEDAADLAGLIGRISSEPVHLVGSSYGANVALTVAAARRDLVVTAAVHEPPLFGLLEGTQDPTLHQQLASTNAELAIVRELLVAGRHREAAEHFVENVALGAGTWTQLPEHFRATLERNAPTYLDEMDDDTALTIDTAALAATTVPLLMTYGTRSPTIFPAVIAELARLTPARVEVIDGAGHVPHLTHTEHWVSRLVAFHGRAQRAVGAS
jgi:pimeloyl-ACP methyl ester carboxylesterase